MDKKQIEKLRFHIVTLNKIRVSKYDYCFSQDTRKTTKRKEFRFHPVLLLKYRNPGWWILPSPAKIGYLFLFDDPKDNDVIIQCYILCGVCLWAVAVVKSGMEDNIRQQYNSYTRMLNEIQLALLCDTRVTKEDIIKIYDLYRRFGVNEKEFNPTKIIDDVSNS